MHRPRLSAAASTDSISDGSLVFRRASVRAEGYADSLDWTAGTTIGDLSRLDGTGGGTGRTARRRSGSIRSPRRLAAHRYRLRRRSPSRSPTPLPSWDRSPCSRRTGRRWCAPRKGAGVGARRADRRRSGTRPARSLRAAPARHHRSRRRGGARPRGGWNRRPRPRFVGSPGCPTARFGDFQAPFVQGVVEHEGPAPRRQPRSLAHGRRHPAGRSAPAARSRLQRREDIGGWRGRSRCARTPTAWTSGLLEALTPAVTQVHGTLAADVQVEGTWASPRLAGKVERDRRQHVGAGPRCALRYGQGRRRAPGRLGGAAGTCCSTSGGGRLEADGRHAAGGTFPPGARPQASTRISSGRSTCTAS